MIEFFSSVSYLSLDNSPVTLYKTGFSELAKHQDALQALQKEEWFNVIKGRLGRIDPEAHNEIFGV
jgi:hypothetical protein